MQVAVVYVCVVASFVRCQIDMSWISMLALMSDHWVPKVRHWVQPYCSRHLELNG